MQLPGYSASLRLEGDRIDYTPEMLEEWKRCHDDIIYFAEKYVYVNSIDSGYQLVKLRDYQKELLLTYMDDSNPDKMNTVVLSSRQSGKTETSAIFMLHYILFNKDKRVAVLANHAPLAYEIVSNIKRKYENLPKFLQQGVKKVQGWSAGSIRLENGCEMRAAATTPDSIRGFTVNVLFLDEFGVIDPKTAKEFMKAVFPTVSSGKTSKIIISSCVVKDTMVFTPDGIKTVGDFVVDDGRVLGYEVPKYEVLGRYGMNHGHVMHNDGDPRETRIITTRYSEVETSMQHKFWTCRDGVYGVRRAKDLKVGDYVMVKCGMNCWGNDRIEYDDTDERMRFHLGHIDEITEDMAYLFGLYIAEGNAESEKNKRLCITCGDDVSGVFERLGLKFCCRDGIHYTVASKAIIKLLQTVGFDLSRHANRKIIPSRLLQMSKRNVSAMLRGMFDGDGCSNTKRKRITYVSTSKRLIDQIRVLLTNFGILSTIVHNFTKPTKKVRVSSEEWTIEIEQQDMVDKFFDEIGFGLERKAKTRFTQIQRSPRLGHFDYIPYSAIEIRKLKKAGILSHEVFCLKGGVCNKDSIHLNRKRVLKIKSKLPEEVWSKYDCFRNAEPDCVWTQIREIKESKNKVYDFSLDDDNYGGYGDAEWAHSVIHNSTVCFQTPKGMVNPLYDIWDKASRGIGTFKPIKVDWTRVPGRDEDFKKKTIEDIGILAWRQEYECAFLGSSKLLVEGDSLMQYGIPREPIRYEYNERLRIYEDYKQGCSYVIGIDPAVGNGGDFACIQILRIDGKDKVEQVAVFSDNMTQYEIFSQIAVDLAARYNNPPMMVENNGVGTAVVNKLFYDLEYPEMVHLKKKGIGCPNSKQTKLEMCLLFKQYFEQGMIKLNDAPTIRELTTFEETQVNVFKASGTAHDDLVMAVLWALYYLKTPYFDEGAVLPAEMQAVEEEPINAFISSQGNGSFLDEEYSGGWV